MTTNTTHTGFSVTIRKSIDQQAKSVDVRIQDQDTAALTALRSVYGHADFALSTAEDGTIHYQSKPLAYANYLPDDAIKLAQLSKGIISLREYQYGPDENA